MVPHMKHHRGDLYLEPERDTHQLLTLFQQPHLDMLAKFINLYVWSL